jgi:hypothetical protein
MRILKIFRDNYTILVNPEGGCSRNQIHFPRFKGKPNKW